MSNKKNYFNMFKSPLFSKDDVNKLIDNTRKEFKRNDIVVWFLKYYKYHTLSKKLGESNTNENVSERKWVSQFEARNPTWKVQDPTRIGSVKEFIKHSIDLNIPEINNVRFGSESFEEISRIIVDIEEEWRAQLEDAAVEEYGTKILSFPDGSAWFDLERSGCSTEADAMGHCGNGSGRSGQTLLSYRRPMDDPSMKHWSPRLTFILDTNTGSLGEMKGRANERPAERYHPYIVDLLNLDCIKKVVGGGYKPEANFSLQHLKPEKRDELLKTKPSLFSIGELMRIYKGRLPECPVNISDALKEEIDTKAIEINGSNWYLLRDNMDLEAMCKTFRLKELKSYTKTLEDGYFEMDTMTKIKDHYYATDTLDGLKSKYPEQYEQLIDELKVKCDSDDLECLNLETSKGLCKALELEDDDLKVALQRALSDGDEVGAMNDLYTEFDNFLKSPIKRCSGLIFQRDENSPDTSFHFLASEEYILDLLSNDSFFEEANDNQCEGIKESLLSWIDTNEDTEDLNVPQYGFSGFDQDCAIDALSQHLGEVLPDIIKQEIPIMEGAIPFGTEINTEALSKLAHQPSVQSITKERLDAEHETSAEFNF
jgi:hypothetical protein